MFFQKAVISNMEAAPLPPPAKQAKQGKTAKIPLAPHSLSGPPPPPPTIEEISDQARKDAIRDPVQFMKTSMQQTYNETLADKLTEAIDPKNVPTSFEAIRDFNEMKKAAEAPLASAKPSRAKQQAALSEPTDISPDAAKRLALLHVYDRYKSTYEDIMRDIQWPDLTRFMQLTTPEMQSRLDIVRKRVNRGAKNTNIVEFGILQIANALANITKQAASQGFVGREYDLAGTYGGVNVKAELEKQMKEGKLDEEIQQLWCEYADYMNFGPGTRLAMKIIEISSKAIEQNAERIKANLQKPVNTAAATKSRYSNL